MGHPIELINKNRNVYQTKMLSKTELGKIQISTFMIVFKDENATNHWFNKKNPLSRIRTTDLLIPYLLHWSRDHWSPQGILSLAGSQCWNSLGVSLIRMSIKISWIWLIDFKRDLLSVSLKPKHPYRKYSTYSYF